MNVLRSALAGVVLPPAVFDNIQVATIPIKAECKANSAPERACLARTKLFANGKRDLHSATTLKILYTCQVITGRKPDRLCRSLARSGGIPGSGGGRGGEGREKEAPRMKSPSVKSSKQSAKASVAQTRPDDCWSTAWSMPLPPALLRRLVRVVFSTSRRPRHGTEPGYESAVCRAFPGQTR